MSLSACRRAVEVAERAFREAWLRGCSMGDCDQAYWLAYDGIEPAQLDHDYQPSPP
jgi:hypothetical protein